MQSKAVHVLAYRYELPADCEYPLLALCNNMHHKLCIEFQEGLCYGKTEYTEPHRIVPDVCHSDPKKTLQISGIASQKKYISICHQALAAKPFLEWLIQKGFIHFINKLDTGKYLMCFQKAEHMAISLLIGMAEKMSLQDWIGNFGKNIKSSIKYSVHA